MDLGFESPVAAMTLRGYQEEAVEACVSDMASGEKSLLVMATGTGKTVVFSEIVRRYMERTKSLVLAHREELIDQAIRKIAAHTGYTAGKEKAQEYADFGNRIVVGSVQSLRGNRLARWKPDHFGLAVIDEAHHVAAVSYRNILEHFSSADILGVTATPDRADEKQLGDVFTKVSFEYPLHKAIEDGNLVRIVGRRVKDFDIDLSGLKVVAGDYQDSELAEVIEKYIGPMAHNIEAETRGMSTLVFMPNVESSRLMAEALDAKGLKAGWISGGTDTEDRKRTLYQFAQGQITHLVSCNVLLEGYDEPRVEAIVMCRPTGSRAVYAQAIGRGTRLYPGKSSLLLVEFTFNSSRLKLVSAYELFSTMGFGERVQEQAKKKGSTSEYEDFYAGMIEANKHIFDTRSIIERLPIKRYGFTEFDPLAIADLIGVDLSGEFNIQYKGHRLEGPATEKQKDLLRRYNVANVETFDKAQASALIDGLMKKAAPAFGDASDKQVNYLRKLGYKVGQERISKAQAGVLITILGAL